MSIKTALMNMISDTHPRKVLSAQHVGKKVVVTMRNRSVHVGVGVRKDNRYGVKTYTGKVVPINNKKVDDIGYLL